MKSFLTALPVVLRMALLSEATVSAITDAAPTTVNKHYIWILDYVKADNGAAGCLLDLWLLPWGVEILSTDRNIRQHSPPLSSPSHMHHDQQQ
jgi:hypothetical protein